MRRATLFELVRVVLRVARRVVPFLVEATAVLLPCRRRTPASPARNFADDGVARELGLRRLRGVVALWRSRSSSSSLVGFLSTGVGLHDRLGRRRVGRLDRLGSVIDDSAAGLADRRRESAPRAGSPRRDLLVGGAVVFATCAGVSRRACASIANDDDADRRRATARERDARSPPSTSRARGTSSARDRRRDRAGAVGERRARSSESPRSESAAAAAAAAAGCRSAASAGAVAPRRLARRARRARRLRRRSGSGGACSGMFASANDTVVPVCVVS